jgi:hypothetical protein
MTLPPRSARSVLRLAIDRRQLRVRVGGERAGADFVGYSGDAIEEDREAPREQDYALRLTVRRLLTVAVGWTTSTPCDCAAFSRGGQRTDRFARCRVLSVLGAVTARPLRARCARGRSGLRHHTGS